MCNKAYRTKKYPHFDKIIPYRMVESYVTNPECIGKHSFFPLIRFDKKQVKYSKEGLKYTKNRTIMYACHIDGYIYKYYGDKLNVEYNQILSDRGINSCVIAYRNCFPHQNNIQFAKAVFQYIRQCGSCYIRVSDYESFFDNLQHDYLKNQINQVLGVERLLKDWYKVFTSITRHCYINKTEIAPYYDKRAGKYFTSIRDYRTFRKQNKSKFYVNNNKKGIPQGTAISGVMANVYMLDVDEQIYRLVNSLGGLYRRYSDDSIIVIPKAAINESGFQKINEKIKQIIDEADVSEQHEKTHIFECIQGYIINGERKSTELDYLGFGFDGLKVKVRQRGIYKFERKNRKSLQVARNKKRRYRLEYLPYKRRLFRNSGASSKDSNFLTYINRSTLEYANNEKLQWHGEKQIANLRKKVRKNVNKCLAEDI